MKQITILSGKGGTGKSTWAVLLALKLSMQGERILLCDCDVECPNDYLLLGQGLFNPQLIYQKVPELKTEQCESCGLCSTVCKEHAIRESRIAETLAKPLLFLDAVEV